MFTDTRARPMAVAPSAGERSRAPDHAAASPFVGLSPTRQRRVALGPGPDLFLPLAFTAMSLAVLVIAASYAAARTAPGTWPPVLYWVGELGMFAATLVVLLGRPHHRPALTAAIFGFNLGQYLIKVMYSPLRLKFPDELQHEQSALGMLTTGHLFSTNYSLPISPLYPGLEALTVGLVKTLGISLYVSELLVAGLAHLLLAAGVLLLFRIVVRRDNLAALGALVYSVGSYQAFFNSMYIYQSLALPFAVLIVVQVLGILRGDPPRPRTIVTFALSAGVVVTHHVTALFVVATLAGVAVTAACVRRYRHTAAWLAAAAVVSMVLLAGWVTAVAPETIGYLAEPLRELLDSFHGGVSNAAAPLTAQPPVERFFTYAVVALPLLMLSTLAVVAWRRRARNLAVVGATGAALQLAVVAVRFVASNGQELAGRAQNFLTLYVAVGLAACFGLMLAGHRRHGLPAIVGVLSVLFVGGLTSGWPPGYERLPGSYQVASFETSVDPHAVASAEWVRAHMSPGHRFGSDFGNLAVIGTLGNQFPVNSPYSDLFYRTYFDPRDAVTVRSEDIQFLLIDSRLHTQYPPPDSYSYFAGDSLDGRYDGPLALDAIGKFRDIAGVTCLFDDGTVQIYGMEGSRYVDPSQ